MTMLTTTAEVSRDGQLQLAMPEEFWGAKVKVTYALETLDVAPEGKAKLIIDEDGRAALRAPEGAPEMTSEYIKTILYGRPYTPPSDPEQRAQLIRNEDGSVVLRARPGAPEMTSARIKAIVNGDDDYAD